MRVASLGSHARLIRGITFKPSQVCDPKIVGAVACMRTKNVQSDLDESDLIGVPSEVVKNPEKFLRAGDILVSSANSWNLVGKCCYVPRLDYRATAGGFISILRPTNAELDARYLYRWFSSEVVQRTVRLFGNQTTNISNLDHKRTLGLQIPLPPLAEQKRIAGILDAADALRAKRRAALAQLDTLLQSTFLDIFGDPVTNPMGWEVGKLGDWLENIDSGWSPTCLERKAEDHEWGVLKLGAVTRCEFDGNEQKALPLVVEPRPGLEVKAGDLLFARKNTYELVAAATYVFNARPRLMLSDLIFRLKIMPTVPVDPLFLWKLLVEPRQRQSIQRLAGGAAGSMPNISKAKLKSVELIRPPLSLQRRFATIVESVERQKARMRAHLAELDALFASLQFRAFSGTL